MAAYRFEGYWKDVGTLDSLWDANMDMLSPGSGLNLLDKKWPIYGRTPNCPPTFVGPEGAIGNSAEAKGCTSLGEVKNAVLSYGSSVREPGCPMPSWARAAMWGRMRWWAAPRAAWTSTAGALPCWDPTPPSPTAAWWSRK